jgi:membrane associated rhomboid family serine protease
MLPLKDDIPSQRTPVVTLALIGANVLVFFYQLSLSVSGDPGSAHAAEQLVMDFGAMPCRLTGACRAADEFPHPALTVFTSMFLHGGLVHVGGNMLYLWIFGDNVEDALGHGRFALFYLASGVAAAWGQTLVNPSSSVPMVGASGAISGVLGAYLLLFPYARILTLITFGFFIRFVYIPAIVVLGFWIVLQFFAGLAAFSVASGPGRETGGVAWFAHVGGFVVGIALLFVLRPRRGRRL